MIILSSTTHDVVVHPLSDSDLDCVASWVDMTASATTEGSTQDTLTVSGAASVVGSPAASTKRVLKSLSVANKDVAPVDLHVDFSLGGGTVFVLHPTITLHAGDSLHYEDGRGWYVVRATDANNYAGRSVAFFKVGTAADTVGYFYCHAKDSGFPGAWAPGTPGLAGRTTDGTASADAGALVIPNAATGGNYLTSFELASTVAQFFQLIDILWVNSGIVVTTTTAQTVNSVTLPARDANGTTNGEGCLIGLLFTAAATNAAVINNATVSYTNSAGTAGRTATLANLVGAQIPATPTIGTIVWFQLAAGDEGVRSIQSITLGTSLVTGSVSLVIARQLATYSSVVANVGNGPQRPMDPGIRLHNGVCAVLCYQASATTATTVSGSVTVQERAL